jgi:hypothetical protein
MNSRLILPTIVLGIAALTSACQARSINTAPEAPVTNPSDAMNSQANELYKSSQELFEKVYGLKPKLQILNSGFGGAEISLYSDTDPNPTIFGDFTFEAYIAKIYETSLEVAAELYPDLYANRNNLLDNSKIAIGIFGNPSSCLNADKGLFGVKPGYSYDNCNALTRNGLTLGLSGTQIDPVTRLSLPFGVVLAVPSAELTDGQSVTLKGQTFTAGIYHHLDALTTGEVIVGDPLSMALASAAHEAGGHIFNALVLNNGITDPTGIEIFSDTVLERVIAKGGIPGIVVLNKPK